MKTDPHYIEFQGLYDGWLIEVFANGTYKWRDHWYVETMSEEQKAEIETNLEKEGLKKVREVPKNRTVKK